MLFYWNKVSSLTKCLIGYVIFLGGISIVSVAVFSEEIGMFICRGISVIGAAMFLIVSVKLWINCYVFCHKHLPSQKFSISTTIKLFVFAMSIVCMSGYFFKLDFIYLLKDYDFASSYTFSPYILLIDVFYEISILIYVPTQLFYFWFYIPIFGAYGINKNFFGLTVITNFWQKWLFETLRSKEKICEELIQHNRTCSGHYHYRSNFTMLSTSELEVYHLMEMIDPFSYSCTMELIVVLFVVICYCKPKRNHHPQIDHHHENPFSINSKFANFLKFLMVFQLGCCFVYFSVKFVTIFRDEKCSKEIEMIVHNWIKLVAVVAGITVYGCLFWVYRNVKPEIMEEENDDDDDDDKNDIVDVSERNSSKCCLTCWLFPVTVEEPDLLIIHITWFITFLLSFIKIGFQIYGGALKDANELLFNILPDLIGLVSFALNLKILSSFLTCDPGTFGQLSHNHFTTRWLIPFQIIRPLIRASSKFIVVLDPQPSPQNDMGMDEGISLINAAYPFTPLMNITFALCWGHVLEKFFERGAYSFIPDGDDGEEEDSQGKVESSKPFYVRF